MAICLCATVHSGASRSRRSWQEPVIFLFHDRIALAGALFQSAAIDHRDTASPIVDQSRFVQYTRHLGDSLAADTQHVGNQLLSHDELTRFQAVAATHP